MTVFDADLIVIGAGPAGLACAAAAADNGVRVVLIDAGVRMGGQYWRHGGEHSASAHGEGHHGWDTFRQLRGRVEQARERGILRYLPRTHVWMVHRDGTGFAAYTAASATRPVAGDAGGPPQDVIGGRLRAPQLALCAGGYDRQLPSPGWDLPGVMAAGGVQAFIKTNGFSPGRRVVVAGTGPFLLSVAASVAHSGARVVAVCEANSPTRWLPRLHRAAGAPGKLLEGGQYAATFAAHRIPYRLRTVVTRAFGTSRLEAVELARVDAAGRVLGAGRRRVEADLLALGWGFTPLLELPVSLGADTRVDVDGSLVCDVDDRGRTSVAGVFAAGEVTGVGGAALAVAEGHNAGLAAAGLPLPARLGRRIARLRAFAEAMHQAHPVPAGWRSSLEESTLICRCEEVTVGEVTGAADRLAGTDARSSKSFTRAGMGWCQGRECGFAVNCLHSSDPMVPDAQALRASQKRPLSTPVPLGVISTIDTMEETLEGMGDETT